MSTYWWRNRIHEQSQIFYSHWHHRKSINLSSYYFSRCKTMHCVYTYLLELGSRYWTLTRWLVAKFLRQGQISTATWRTEIHLCHQIDRGNCCDSLVNDHTLLAVIGHFFQPLSQQRPFSWNHISTSHTCFLVLCLSWTLHEYTSYLWTHHQDKQREKSSLLGLGRTWFILCSPPTPQAS